MNVKFKSKDDCFTLNNGVSIPCVGYGTWRAPDGDVAKAGVLAAIEAGYRHIDTASAYHNERSVGAAVAECGVPRSELFITSKLWNRYRGYDSTLAAFEQSCADLGVDYLDLYLIHWPANAAKHPDCEAVNLATWRAFEKLYKDGRIRAIGLSNFTAPYLAAILREAEVIPAIDQLELHPGYDQCETLAMCAGHDIVAEAWSPLGSGAVLDVPLLAEIGARYGKSPAQVCVRYALDKRRLPLPKSVTPARIAQNIDVFDFELTCEEIAAIDALPETGFSGMHPDSVPF